MSYLRRAGIGGLILGTLAIGVPAWGDPSHDQARQVLTQADADLAAAQQRADTAQQLSDAAKTRSAELASQIADERKAAKELRDRLERAEAAVPEIQAKIDNAAARQSARRKEMIVEDLKYGPLKYADDQVRLDAIRDFEASPEHRSSLTAVDDQAKAVRAIEEKSLAAFSRTLEYQQAANSHASLDALREQRLSADPNVLIARNRLAEAKKGVDALRRRFMDEQLPQIPKVKLADDALGAEQVIYDQLAAAAKAAEAEGATAQAIMDRQKAGLASDHATLGRMNAEVAQLEAQNTNALADVDRAGKGLQIAVAYLNSSEESRANAQAALDQLDAPPAAAPALPYYGNYSPPNVIYIQPSPNYIAAPYYNYGGIYVAPARVPFFGFGPARGGFGGQRFHGDGHSHGNNGGGHR